MKMDLWSWPAAACALLMAPAAAAEQLSAGAGFGARPVENCGTDLSYLNQVTGWQTAWPAEWTAIASAPADEKAQDAALTRWREAPNALQADIAGMKAGLRAKRAAPRSVALRVLQQTDGLLVALGEDGSAYYAAPGPKFSTEWRALLEQEIAPAIASYRAFLSDEYLPKLHEKSALASLKDDGACFMNAARWWTTLSLPSAEIEAAGERLLVETKADLVAHSATGESIDEILDRLRRAPQEVPTSSEDLMRASDAALKRAVSALPSWFSAVPTSGISVRAMPEHMQSSFPAGFYQPPSGAGLDGTYVINPSRPSDRRLMAEAIAFHEGVPGHHLFFAWPRESNVGDFNSGIVEGWAIYAETLADEMGLYATPLDREGMLAKHLWAASRLIIEPRLHSGRWTRGQAIDFMRETTALPIEEIEIEIDRYLAMPGQSLAYMLGAETILAARARAKAAFGDDFDIRKFHDVILEPGLRPLPALVAAVDDWIAEGARQGDDGSL